MSKPTVAVVGVSSFLGKSILQSLTSSTFRDNYSFPIHALTQDASKHKDTADVKYYTTGDFSDSSKNLAALKGVDVVIDATGLFVDITKLVDSIAEAGVKVFIPGIYGSYPDNTKYKPAFGRLRFVEQAKSLGIKTVPQVHVGLFYRWSLSVPPMFGFDFENQAVERFAGGDYKIGLTSEVDIGNTLASLAHKQTSIPDHIFINGTQLTQNDIIAAYEKQTGKKLKVSDVSKDEVRKRGEAALNKEPSTLTPGDFLFILQALTTEDGAFAFTKDNSAVNPGLWEWEKYEDVAKSFWK